MEKSQKMGNQTLRGHLDGLQNVGAKVGHQYDKRTGTLDKIRNMILKEDEEKGKDPHKGV